jgi:hypothetical protein
LLPFAVARFSPSSIRIALAHKLLVRLNAKARETRHSLQQKAPQPQLS